MGIVDFFKGKQKAEKVDLTQPVSALFHSYLINTASINAAKGGSPYDSNFTSMAKNGQPYTFSQYCAYLQQGYDLTSAGHYNIENMQLYGAQQILNNPNYSSTGTFKNCGRETSLVEVCNYVSTVYEMALATSLRSQTILTQQGKNPEGVELSYSTLDQLQNSLNSNPERAFTSQPFDRVQVDGSEVRTIENPRAEFETICNNGDVNFVYESLDLIKTATAQAQNTMAVMHKDFEVPTQEN